MVGPRRAVHGSLAPPVSVIDRQSMRKPRTRRGFRSCYCHDRCLAGSEKPGLSARAPYIMPSIPPMPPGGIAGPSSFFGFSATVASVVISSPAIDAAF